MLQEIFRAPLTPFFAADRCARAHGALGCLLGIAVVGPLESALGAAHSVLILFDRIATGIANGCCGTSWVYAASPPAPRRLAARACDASPASCGCDAGLAPYVGLCQMWAVPHWASPDGPLPNAAGTRATRS